ncbi:MAG: sulfatase [Pirellulaceae bacterium]|nr:sulfatase [Pirellulaceae bacterium]
MKSIWCPVLVVFFAFAPTLVCGQTLSKPNVLFIAIDDLNDWLGCLGGHPQAKTPNIDRLAQRGVLFSNAHCAAPLCNPSRSSIFSGRPPLETGVFSNDDSSNIRKLHPEFVLIPQHFHNAGYQTFGAGKLLHKTTADLVDEGFFPDLRWSPFTSKQVDYTDKELPSKGTSNPRHVTILNGKSIVLPLNRMPSDRTPDTTGGDSFDWGALEVEDDEMGDGQIATWGAEQLRKVHEKPFFIAIGFYRPHIPLFAPKKYFDLYDGLDIKLPEVTDDDLDDLSPIARSRAIEAETAGAHATVLKYDQWPAAVKSYLACVSFIDAQVGQLLDALDASPNANNTVVMLWSDHGWHLGEKQHWGKWTGWQRSTRVPLIVANAKSSASNAQHIGAVCNQPVSLLDLYPTLIELCQLPTVDGLAGRSLVPLLQNPHQPSDRTVMTTFDRGNYSITGARWHYIRYADGSEELYDRDKDPHEWHNLAHDPKHADRKAELAKTLPDESAFSAPAAGGSGKKKKTKEK